MPHVYRRRPNPTRRRRYAPSKAASGGTVFPITTLTATVSTPASLKRVGQLKISAAVIAAASVVRVGQLKITSGAVALAASVKRVGQLTMNRATVATPASLVKRGVLAITSGAVATPASLKRIGNLKIPVTVATPASVKRIGQLFLGIGLFGGPWVKTTLGQTNQVLGGVVISDVEQLLGRSFVGLRQNQAITTTGWTFASGEYDIGHKRTYRAVDFNLTGDWAAVVAGTYDTQLTDIANNLMALSSKFNPTNPAVIAISHETTISMDAGIGTAQEFIDAYRYIRNFWDGMNATVRSKTGAYLGGPIQMAYIGWNRMFTNGVVNSPPAGHSYTDLDPDLGSSHAPAGTSYYEFCGSDVYNQVSSPGVLTYGTDAATLLDDIVAQASSRGKPFIIGEFGIGDGATTTDHTNKATWLNSAQAYFAALANSGPGTCSGIWLTFKNDASGYMVDSSPQALVAYTAFVNDPTFGHSIRGVASLTRRGVLSIAASAVTTAASVVRRGVLKIGAAVQAAASVLLIGPAAKTPDPWNSIEVSATQRMSLPATANATSIAAQINQAVLPSSRNTITVED